MLPHTRLDVQLAAWKIHVLMLSLPVHQYVFSEVLKKTLLNKKDKKQETATKREDVPFK